MNYLIHAFITREYPTRTVGNIITDMLRPKEVRSLENNLREGVSIHRSIDSYSDQHECVIKSIHRLQPLQRKYAPVAVDLLYDYFLATNWEQYSELSFHTVVHTTYEHLKSHEHLIPSRIRQVINKMVEGKWLHDYHSQKGFETVLKRMDRRASFPSRFGELLNDCQPHWVGLLNDFHGFMPDLLYRMEEELSAMR